MGIPGERDRSRGPDCEPSVYWFHSFLGGFRHNFATAWGRQPLVRPRCQCAVRAYTACIPSERLAGRPDKHRAARRLVEGRVDFPTDPLMMIRPFLCLSALMLVTAPSVAQEKTVAVPFLGSAQLRDLFPLGAPAMRYQLWYSGRELALTAGTPFRMNSLTWFGGPVNGAVAATVEFEILMANAPATFPQQTFDSNITSPPVTVVSRQSRNLPALAPGAPLMFPFEQEFVWDGEGGLVIEVRVFGNGGSTTVGYGLAAQAGLFGRATILSANSFSATTATRFDSGQGLLTEFGGNEGVTTSFGQGCAGEGGFVPVASQTGSFPFPGNLAFAWEVDRVPGNVPCLLTVGISRTTFRGVPLPFDLGVAFGAIGCELLVGPLASVSVVSGPGAVGTANARAPFPIPPLSSIVGVQLFSQWIVLDANSPNGLLSTSQGLWHQFGM